MNTVEYSPTQTQAQRRIRAVKIAVAASFSVGVVEFGLGLALGLESLVAEGLHTLADGLDSIIVLIAVVMAAKPADRCHQFGHGKYEALGAAVEGSFILAAGMGIAYRGIGRLIRGEGPEHIPLYVVAIMAAAAVFYLLVSAYLMREAKATQSPALLAEAVHLRTHIYIAGGIAGGLWVGSLGHWPVVDTLLALAVAICLFFMSGRVFREVARQFTDASLPQADLEKLGKIVGRFGSRFVEVHGLRTRQSGAEKHVEMHLVVMPQTTVAEAHALSHEIERTISGEWPTARITVHIEPLDTNQSAHGTWLEGQPKVHTEEASPEDREFISQAHCRLASEGQETRGPNLPDRPPEP